MSFVNDWQKSYSAKNKAKTALPSNHLPLNTKVIIPPNAGAMCAVHLPCSYVPLQGIILLLLRIQMQSLQSQAKDLLLNTLKRI